MNYFSEVEYLYLIQSSLLYYQDENQISFVSAFYFEYFTASFFKNRTYTDIKKALFIKNGKDVNVQHLNILMIVLNILGKASRTYKKILTDLRKITPCFILLTDFGSLPAETRYKHYETILNHYNKNKTYIYYARFRFASSSDLLANISSLANKMLELLPETYYEKTCALHTETIAAFLNAPSEDTIMPFANSIILLGVYKQKIWRVNQQEKIKEQTISILQFFINDPRAKKLSGLLSENIILHWYALYEWTQKWGKEDWNNFLKKIDENFKSIDFPITNKKEFSFKLKIYNTFYHSADFDTLLYQIIIYLLK